MRIKKAPLRASGMEGTTDCSPTGEASAKANITNIKSEKALQYKNFSLKLKQEKVEASPGLCGRKDAFSAGRDEETQAAQAKLRHYEALGHIKVEVDEASDDQNQPSLDSRVEEQQAQAQAQTPAQPTGVAMVVASSPSLVPFTSSLQEGGFLMCPLPQSPAQTSLIMSQTPIPAPGAPGGMVDVPILSDYEGKYGFTVTVDDKERTTKSPMWLMSNIVNKLYTNINKAVPFEASLKRPTGNEQLFVRAIPVFSSPEFLRINVNRCPNHAAPTDSTNHDFPYPEHVVRADHPAASYRKSASGRLSVVVPLDVQQNTSEYTPILLRFMCLGSCVGGIYRRPISIVLTLENCHEKVLGRKVIDVRVCACPTRDIKTDEQAALNKGNKRKGSSVQVMPVIRKKPRMVEPKMEQEEGGSQVFNLKVCGRQLYDYLVDMKHAYYRHHPEYALRHPDPSSSTNSFSRHKNTVTVKAKLSRTDSAEESDSSVWKHEADSPTHEEGTGNLVIDSQVGSPQSSSINQLLHAQTSLPPSTKLTVADRETNGVDSASAQGSAGRPSPPSLENSNPALSSVSILSALTSASKVVAVVSSLTTSKAQVNTLNSAQSDSTNSSNSTSSRHVPVMQVSSYNPREPAMRRVNSDSKIGSSRQSFAIKKPSLNIPTKVTSPLLVEVGLSSQKEGKLSPGSPEMLAANVLVEGFANKKVTDK